MKKCDIPKPKYSLEDIVVYEEPAGDIGQPMKKNVGKVDAIIISISGPGSVIEYGFESSDEVICEERVLKRFVS